MVSLNLRPFKDWVFNITENRWTTDKISLKWLKKVFIPLTKLVNPLDKRLLIINGYSSYITDNYI